ncbi:HD-GYP domain-containing protein [Clostridium brassicae]|uniref:HD-GYP domain-containing protein n=1 Tax=Clostridium brassicae TaxID=2999072 RepID=A0ABT4DDY6_9CLOT|nr:HD-GYP domain-containing protein [Clostridium brassicae]MCY6959341.1 HD-GYP domain-containing protein [Clostridium brassicae]
MRLEFINRVKENDILGKNILTNDGNILLRAGIKLTNKYISKLRELGVLYVYVEDERLNDVMVEDERLLKIKQIYMKSMSNIVKSLNMEHRVETRDSLRVVENLVEYIIDCGDVDKSLTDIKTYDNYTYVHCIDTCIMATFLGISMNYSESELKELAIGAVLHDIGKTKVPYKIINKREPLTKEEMQEIRNHPIYGKEILEKNMQISMDIIKAVEQHHERVDGSGYPNGLKGYEISRFARIVSICDVYDAVSNNRVYRKKMPPNEAYELILGGSGTLFDEEIVKNFKNIFAIYPLGCCVKLSNNIEGYVIKQNKGFPDRPVIRVLYNSMTREPISFYEIDLLKHLDIVIEGIV